MKEATARYECQACGRVQAGGTLCRLCGASMPRTPRLELVVDSEPQDRQLAILHSRGALPRSALSRFGGVEPPIVPLVGGQAPSLIASEGLSRPSSSSSRAPSLSSAPPAPAGAVGASGGPLEGPSEASRAVSLGSVQRERVERVACGWGDVDAAFGGGLPRARVVLVGGVRGTGKTALAIPVCVGFATATSSRAFYYSAEGEAAAELAGKAPPELELDVVDVLEGDELEELAREVRARRPSIAVIDSLQSVRVPGTTIGTDKHARLVLEELHALSREGTTIVALSQMNAEGGLRGSQIYQQLCDSIAMLERDELGRVVLRMDGKNRGGPIDRKAFFRFDDDGALRGTTLEGE